MRLSVAQHVSGVLTSKQSPRGHAGYQTLFFTQDRLAPEDLRVIERQVQNASGRQGKAKWQSYRLSANRHVISRIIPISEPDEFGRRGRFFSHSLILEGTGGLQVDEFLFDFVRPSLFLSSLDKVLECEGLKSGHIATVSIEAKKEWLKEGRASLREWSGEQLNQLYLLMSNPTQLTEQGQYVGLIGSDEQIVDSLKVAFLLAPVSARKFCSFDTDAPGGNEQSDTSFWGRGIPAPSEAGFVIDATCRKITISDSHLTPSDGLSIDELSAPLRNAILERLRQPSEQMLLGLFNQNYAGFIAEPLYQALLHQSGLALTKTELELLSRFTQTHSGLAVLLALEAGNESERMRTLAAMDLSSFQQRAKELRTKDGFKPWQMFSPIFLPVWFELFRGTYTLDDITTILRTVFKHGNKQDRQYLETIHEYLDPQERLALGRWLRSSPNDFGDLQATFDKPGNETVNNSGTSLWRRMFRSK